VIAACKFLGRSPAFLPELIADALGNMFTNGTWTQEAQPLAA
jgi:hypothetical protein